MSPRKRLASAADVNDEVAALISTLHDVEQRLAELTSNEVDTVTNRDGEPFMLRRAQEQLRASEAAKQVAILNALPAYIALLDTHGMIISVNEAWRQFGTGSAIQGPGYDIGVNYLETCDGVGRELFAAHQTAAGIRSVLAGRAKNFSIEYSGHTATQQRWFLLKVTPLGNENPKGAIVMHLDVTAERHVKETLHASETRFRQMAENIRDVFFLDDTVENRMVYVSPAYEEIWGRSCESLYADPDSWGAAIHPEDRAATHEKYNEHKLVGQFELEYRIVRPDHSIRWIEARGFPVLDDNGTLVRIAGVAKDITDRKQAENRIAYLNRVYAMLSGIDTLIVRARDRDELFREACRIAVDAGGFQVCVLGLVDRDGMSIAPIAACSKDVELSSTIKGILSSPEDAPTHLVTRAISEKKTVVSNDLQHDPDTQFRAQYAASGVRSMAVLPLIVANETVGVLALYANEIEFFQNEELKLLTELAGDIAFAMGHIRTQERLDYLASYDMLTGLANRALFYERLEQTIVIAQEHDSKLALMLLDIERFKTINDSLGRPVGDALLKAVAARMADVASDVSRLGRLDADHFAVIVSKFQSEEQLAHQIEKCIAEVFGLPFGVGTSELRLAAKIGIAMFPADGANADTLFKNAETALKNAKLHGERYLFYTQAMNARVAEKLTLENQLSRALDNGEFVLHYQPKINLVTGQVTSAEALIRWNDPRTGLVSPARFISVLEETGMIQEVGRWALRKTIEDYLRWRNAGLPAVRIAVNVSARQLRHRGFISEVKHAIGIHPDAAAGLELEITESLIMADVKHSITSLQTIRTLGVTIAIDDFGTGFSSLSYLAKLPVDALKIERSFVIDMTAAPEGLALVSTIINLAHSLKLKVVAEGVETEEQSRLLRLLGCDETQGFLFSKPVPADLFESKFLINLPPGSVGTASFNHPFPNQTAH